jgi:hypothetical protein
MTEILAAIAALGTIIGGVVYLVKFGAWTFKKPQAEVDQSIDEKILQEKREVQDGGRPKWE